MKETTTTMKKPATTPAATSATSTKPPAQDPVDLAATIRAVADESWAIQAKDAMDEDDLFDTIAYRVRKQTGLDVTGAQVRAVLHPPPPPPALPEPPSNEGPGAVAQAFINSVFTIQRLLEAKQNEDTANAERHVAALERIADALEVIALRDDDDKEPSAPEPAPEPEPEPAPTTAATTTEPEPEPDQNAEAMVSGEFTLPKVVPPLHHVRV